MKRTVLHLLKNQTSISKLLTGMTAEGPCGKVMRMSLERPQTDKLNKLLNSQFTLSLKKRDSITSYIYIRRQSKKETRYSCPHLC